MLDILIMKFKERSKVYSLLFSLSLLALLVFTSCEQKKNQEVPVAKDKVQGKVEEPKAEEPKVEEPKIQQAPSIKGIWKGTFYNKSMTMYIGEQTDKDFEGETTVNWAKPLTMKVKGSFDPKALTMKFADQSSAKDAGSYEGTLSADLKSFTGKFAVNRGGRKFDVKLSLQ